MSALRAQSACPCPIRVRWPGKARGIVVTTGNVHDEGLRSMLLVSGLQSVRLVVGIEPTLTRATSVFEITDPFDSAHAVLVVADR